MFSYWAYVLIGNNNSGKTGFQRHLVSELGGQPIKSKLSTNLETRITHPRMPRAVETLSTMNRSYQEKIGVYGSVQEFFENHFQPAEICILASHSHDPAKQQLTEMIRELRLQFYNVAAVFFSNSNEDEAAEISLLNWDERLWINNPKAGTDEEIDSQLRRLAGEFAQMLIARAAVS